MPIANHHPLRTLLLAVTLITVSLAGCIDASESLEGSSANPDLPGTDDVYETARGWSEPQQPAEFDILPGVEATLPSFDGTRISLGIFLPDIPGCDWQASDLPERCQVPVVIDSGPYWADAEEERSYRPPLVEWLVPRGYAVAHMSIRGTGESGGCMEFMSMAEQRDVSETITWLAERPWSTGDVGMMGRSYDGTTPLMGAALGNPHLKTIVPISGVWDAGDLMFKNGTSESRGPIMHSAVYWGLFGVGAVYGTDAVSFRAEHWQEQACEEFATGAIEGPRATLSGDVSTQYWEEREFTPRILENYEGSVWIVHGMQDWNVNPSQAVPFIQDLQEAGIPTKAWLGQWDHAYPDRVDEHRNARWDWATETVAWFDHWLKDEGPQPELNVEVEDHLFVWREEDTYPPEDFTWEHLQLGSDGTLEADGEDGGFVAGTGTTLGLSTEPLESNMRIAGMPRLHVTVTPSTSDGGYLFAELHDVWPDGTSMRIGWAAIDLQYHDGGNEDPQPLVPGEPVVAKMEFEPMDAHVAQGHELRLLIHQNGVEDILESPSKEPLRIDAGDGSTLMLPTIERPATLAASHPAISE